MGFHRRSRSRGRSIDPSIDPSTYFGSSAEGPDRKTFQLCRQVARSLGLALGGAIHDDILNAVLVDRVTPAPDAGHLLVTVVPAAKEADTDEILRRLQEKKAYLRAWVAGDIHRKRAPELSFCVAWPDEGEVTP